MVGSDVRALEGAVLIALKPFRLDPADMLVFNAKSVHQVRCNMLVTF